MSVKGQRGQKGDTRCNMKRNLVSKVGSKDRRIESAKRRELELKKVGKIGNGAVEGGCIQLSMEGKMCIQPGEKNGRGQQAGEEQNSNSVCLGEKWSLLQACNREIHFCVLK